MNDSKPTQGSEKKSGTRYIRITKYEDETSGVGRNDTSSMKNFPRAFIPMKELEESPSKG